MVSFRAGPHKLVPDQLSRLGGSVVCCKVEQERKGGSWMQNRWQFVRIAIGLGVLIGIGGLYAGNSYAGAAAPPRPAKLTCSETLRRETQSHETLNGSVTDSVTGGKLT